MPHPPCRVGKHENCALTTTGHTDAGCPWIPWMAPVALLARAVAHDREMRQASNPHREQEDAMIANVSEVLASVRKLRDSAAEQAFANMYGWPDGPSAASGGKGETGGAD